MSGILLYRSSLVCLAALCALVYSGCAALECGEGTIERDGECRAADAMPDDQACGPGTIFTEGGICVPVLECGEGTEAVPQPDGSVRCLPIGGGGQGCGSLISQCRAPTDGALGSICGVLIDIENNQPFAEPDAEENVELCDQANPTTTGPCSVQIRTFNPIGFTPDSSPLAVGSVVQDTCGRFALNDVALPAAPFVALATGNVHEPGEDEGPTVADTYRATGTAVVIAGGELLTSGVVAAVMRNETDEQWTAMAGGLVDDKTLAQRGLYVPVFLVGADPDNLTPVEGVRVTRDGGPVFDNTFYFDDTSGDARTTISSDKTATGPNGTALMVEQPIGVFSGTGGEPNGCTWPIDQAGTAEDIVFFQPKIAHVSGDPGNRDCPQP